MTLVPQEQFMRFLGTMQLLLFKLRPQFYAASYLRELELLKERHIEKKPAYNLTDFAEQVFKLFGANINALSFEEIASDIRAVFFELYQTKMSAKARRKYLKRHHSRRRSPVLTVPFCAISVWVRGCEHARKDNGPKVLRKRLPRDAQTGLHYKGRPAKTPTSHSTLNFDIFTIYLGT